MIYLPLFNLYKIIMGLTLMLKELPLLVQKTIYYYMK